MEENKKEREIIPEKKGKLYTIKDTAVDVKERDAEGMVMWFTQVYQNNSASLQKILELQKELEMYWGHVEDNELWMDKVRPLVKKAKLELVLEQKKKERAGKKDGTG